MTRIRFAGVAVMTTLAAACVVVPPSQMGGQKSQTPADSAVVKMLSESMLPALYRGDLPCADCAGIRYALDLRPTRVFFLRTTYLGKGSGEGESFDDIGRWSLTADARTLILSGGRESSPRFSIENSETLRLLDQAGQPIKSALNYELRRVPSYAPLEPSAAMRGMYSYMADSGRFRECLTQLDLPVEQAGDNRALESAYASARQEPGLPVLASLEGQIAMRPKMEGEGKQETLVVNRFNKVSAGESCDSAQAATALENTTWGLVQVAGNALTVAADRKEPYFLLESAEKRMQGFAGCNRMSGPYESAGTSLRFGAVIATKMACMDPSNPEDAFLRALIATTRWNIAGKQLELYDSAGTVVARLEARAKP